MKLLTCALPDCDNPLVPGRLTFGLGGNSEKYCSRGCVTIAFELMRKSKPYKKSQPKEVDYTKQDEREEAAARAVSMQKEEEVVKVKAEQFGGAEVYRRYCDNPVCKAPITVCWKGRRGEYCSNNCLKTEKDNKMANETESPIAAGAPATKKNGKKNGNGKKHVNGNGKTKAVKKTAKAAKEPKADSERAANNAKVITIVKSEKMPEYRGVKVDITKQIKDGITVGQFKAAVASKVPGRHSWDSKNVLEAAVEAGAIKIK